MIAAKKPRVLIGLALGIPLDNEAGLSHKNSKF
jgi:hypothetical protein